jgi:hypothetical protein
VSENEKLNNHLLYSMEYYNGKNPFMKININNIDGNFLIDTGSSVNIIHSRYTRGMNLYYKRMNLRLANDKLMEIDGCIKTELKFFGITYSAEFVVAKGISADGILKTPFIKENNLSLGWKDGWIVKCSYKENMLGTHRIRTVSETPVCSPLYRIGILHEEAASKIIKEYLDLEIIRRSSSPWKSPIVVVNKNDGGFRLCVDYRKLNEITIRDSYPMQRADEFFDALTNAKVFTKFDAKSGYHQIAMDDKDVEKKAFGCRDGLFEFVKMPFGLERGPATFQRVMNNILRRFLRKFVVVYIDDILIYSKSYREHEEHVKIVVQEFKRVGLKLNEKKCEFNKTSVNILGHVVTNGSLKMDNSRIQTIKSYKQPKTVKEMESFLGTINYCSKFIKNLSVLTAGLYRLLKKVKEKKVKDIEAYWNDKLNADFERIKEEICKDVSLTIPNTTDVLFNN